MLVAEPQEAIDALSHPWRREVLKYYIEQAESLSQAQVAKALAADASNTTYHVHALEGVGARLVDERAVRGTTEHFYIYKETFIREPWVRSVLGLPELSE